MSKEIYKAKKNDPSTEKMFRDQTVSVVIDTFKGLDCWKIVKTFPCITVFYDTTDFPGKYVARLFDGPKPTRLMVKADTLDQIHETIPDQFYKAKVTKRDIANKIVETYI